MESVYEVVMQLSPHSPRALWNSPIILVLFSMASIHVGGAVSKGMFEHITPLGIVSLRLGLGALVLLLFSRPRWRHLTWQDYRLLGMLGLATGIMNVLFFSAIAYIPIGVAVTLEFVGPLGLALVYCRRKTDLLLIGMAAAGVVLLSPFDSSQLHPLGVIFSLTAGGCWAAYISLTAKVGKSFAGSEGLAMSMLAGAIAIVPFGLAVEGRHLFEPAVLLPGLAIAVLSSVLPYSLEVAALRQMPVKIFGVLMSLEPAIASCIGMLLLGEQLTFKMVIALALVSVASAGAAVKPVEPA